MTIEIAIAIAIAMVVAIDKAIEKPRGIATKVAIAIEPIAASLSRTIEKTI